MLIAPARPGSRAEDKPPARPAKPPATERAALRHAGPDRAATTTTARTMVGRRGPACAPTADTVTPVSGPARGSSNKASATASPSGPLGWLETTTTAVTRLAVRPDQPTPEVAPARMNTMPPPSRPLGEPPSLADPAPPPPPSASRFEVGDATAADPSDLP